MSDPEMQEIELFSLESIWFSERPNQQAGTHPVMNAEL